jgi:nuclear GTP-binding protein
LAQDMTSSAKAIGADKLSELIKNYSKHEVEKCSVTVGVIGHPNIGKSSVINSLKLSKACGVSSTPGFTKGLQEVIID